MIKGTIRTRFAAVFLAVFFLMSAAAGPAHAQDNIGLVFRGVAKTLVAAFQLPGSILTQSVQQFPLGLITGTVTGTFKMIAGTLSGGADIARGAAPYAKYLVFL